MSHMEASVEWPAPPADQLGELSISDNVKKEECYHCSPNPEKFTPLPKDQQPYCSRCFESMFNFSVPAPAAKSSSSNDSFKVGGVKPPSFKPPEIPPKPLGGGKSAFLYATLPQPFQSKSATTPSISPVPSSTRSVSVTPPPSPPSEASSDQDRGGYESHNHHHHHRSNNIIDLTLPPPPPPLLETDLDSLESDRHSHNSSQSSGSIQLGIYSPSPRYQSPMPIQVTTTELEQAPVLHPSSKGNFIEATTKVPQKSPTLEAVKDADNENGQSRTNKYIGAGNIKFDYKTIAAVPSAVADWKDPEESSNHSHARSSSLSSTSSNEREPAPTAKSNFLKPVVAGNMSGIRPLSPALAPRSPGAPSVSPTPYKHTITTTTATTSPMPTKQYTPAPPPVPKPVFSKPGFQGIRPGPGSWSKPASTSVSNGGFGSTIAPSPPAKPNPIVSSRPQSQVSYEADDNTHLDQINSIFKMGSMKPKPIDPYATTKQDSDYKNKPSSREPPVVRNNPASSKPVVSSSKPTLRCAKCSCNLLGKTVQSSSKGEIICVACFKNEEAELAGCIKCHGPFTPVNQMVVYKGQGWHNGCFSCDKCLKPIGSKTFCKQTDGLFCSDCYFETKGRICVKCKTYLKSTGYIFRNQPWHHECFICHGCNKRLGDEEIYAKDELPYCAPCYDQRFTEKCAKCHKVLYGETVEYDSQQYHDDCFCCDGCTNPIGSASFFPKEGKIFCDVCFTKKFAKNCNKCSRVISPTHGSGLVYKENHYHRDCFSCSHCHLSLQNMMVHSVKNSDEPFCEGCYDELYSKRCAGCTNVISGVIGSRFMSFQGRHWHVECFNCKLCQTSLENRKFVPDQSQGAMLCVPCSKFNVYSQLN